MPVDVMAEVAEFRSVAAARIRLNPPAQSRSSRAREGAVGKSYVFGEPYRYTKQFPLGRELSRMSELNP